MKSLVLALVAAQSSRWPWRHRRRLCPPPRRRRPPACSAACPHVAAPDALRPSRRATRRPPAAAAAAPAAPPRRQALVARTDRRPRRRSRHRRADQPPRPRRRIRQHPHPGAAGGVAIVAIRFLCAARPEPGAGRDGKPCSSPVPVRRCSRSPARSGRGAPATRHRQQGCHVAAAPERSAGHLPAGFDAARLRAHRQDDLHPPAGGRRRGDLNDLRAFTTPEMFAPLRVDLQEPAGASQRTDVVRVDAEVLDVAHRSRAAGRQRALPRPDPRGDRRRRRAVRRDRHLVKPLDGSREWSMPASSHGPSAPRSTDTTRGIRPLFHFRRPLDEHLFVVTGASRGLAPRWPSVCSPTPSAPIIGVKHGGRTSHRSRCRAESGATSGAMAGRAPGRSRSTVAARLQAWLAAHDAARSSPSATLINNAGVVTTIGPLEACSVAGLVLGPTRRSRSAPPYRRVPPRHHGLERRTAGAQRLLRSRPAGNGRQATYCAAKAGIDNSRGASPSTRRFIASGAKVVSLAPGVIDTDMQTQLRGSSDAGFPERQTFVKLKESGQLTSSRDAAARPVAYLDRPDFGANPVADVRDP